MHILVVDDQDLNRAMLEYMLEQEGHQVSMAVHGKDAIERFENINPDIVLLDVIMPEMDGFETAPILKKLAGDLHLPIIFITSLDDQDSMLRCLDVGGDDFLAKPFDKLILSAKIKAHGRSRELSARILEQRNQLKFHQLQTDREHQIVEHIFANALSKNNARPEIVEHYLAPASTFNGDLLLTSRSPLGGNYVFLGDFTGHGLAAAVGALPTAQTFFELTQRGLSAGDIARAINIRLLQLLPNDMFCAACIIELSCSGKAASIWIGGMPDLLIVDKQVGIRNKIQSQHMALGVLDDDEFEHTLINCELSPSDRLVVYTDGITETMNSNDQMFGQERFEALYNKNPKADIIDVIQVLDNYRGKEHQLDDISIVQVNCLSSPSPELNNQKDIPPLPWQVNVELTPDDIKQTDPVAQVLDMVSAFQGMEKHRSTLFLLLAEMYNNSVDHGLLKLDSNVKNEDEGFFEFYLQRQAALENLTEGKLLLNVAHNPQNNSVRLSITDSGDGFDAEQVKAQLKDSDHHGRGLKLICELAKTLDYRDQGRTIIVEYALD
ncbi:response regulator [Catenovulum agarivorans DS-2]|uniref:Response regulator n=1 Tax=Catenovulum agarivorans DS-2 TaxID=1328313 RepID=W7QYA6_9ALTE|nr:fused response regulator/phosphatase [Catenovulum agarivorans]EWH10300.1 response regulator [Catenovulum agarivorans DS-2]